MAYATTTPAELLPRVRQHLAYVARLMDTRKTLDQQRRLVIIGGWLALLRATLHIDLHQGAAADAHLATAAQLANHAGHPEITAWCLETKAWQVLTGGDFRRAVELSRQAQVLAPKGGSVIIQAAEPFARDVIAALESPADRESRPRRIASARLDLGLALVAAQKPDEAAAVTIAAIETGRVVPSNWWRVTEIAAGVDRSRAPEAADLRDALEAYGP